MIYKKFKDDIQKYRRAEEALRDLVVWKGILREESNKSQYE